MGSRDGVFSNDRKGALSFIASAVSCSICLEAVTNNGDRSIAKLQCGHEFHLDCIGSAFNVKGVMQCPNCRKIEKGQWLYANGYHSFSEFANGYHSFSEFSMDEWTHEEDLYDQSFADMHYGLHYCPFRGFTQLSSSFEEGEPPSTAYQDLLGNHGIFAEHSTGSSAARSCPFVALHAYIQPLQPSSSSTSESAADGVAFRPHWAGIPGPGIDIHYRTWEHQSPLELPLTRGLVDIADQSSAPATLRSMRNDPDGVPRAGSLLHPFLLGHGHDPRGANSVVSSAFRPYAGNYRPHAPVHGLHTYPQPSNSQGMRGSVIAPIRTSGSRSLAPIGTPASADHTGFYMLRPSGSASRSMQEGENSGSRNYDRFYSWEREHFAPAPWIPFDGESQVWGPFYYNQTSQVASVLDSGSMGSFWHRGADRRAQGRSESTYQPVHHAGMPPFA